MLKKQSRNWILILCAILFLTASNCSLINKLAPIVEESVIDVLKPDEEINILKINEDGTVLVTAEFMEWVIKLKQEILRLRDLIKDWLKEDKK